MSNPNFVPISWDKYQQDCLQLAQKLHDRQFDGILAISRGGLFPAQIIGYELGIHRIEVLNLLSYTNDNSQSKIEKLNDISVAGLPRWLIIDDLSDTGKTFDYVSDYLDEYKIYSKKENLKLLFAAPYVKPQGEPKCSSYVEMFNQSDWLVFPCDKEWITKPWENKDG